MDHRRCVDRGVRDPPEGDHLPAEPPSQPPIPPLPKTVILSEDASSARDAAPDAHATRLGGNTSRACWEMRKDYEVVLASSTGCTANDE